MVKTILKLEALFIFVVATYLYFVNGGNWILYLLLLFAPDVFMVGYLKNKEVGAKIYNLGHTYFLGILVILAGLYLQNDFVSGIGYIFVAHVGLDRLMGFGLKYNSDFKDTHMQKV